MSHDVSVLFRPFSIGSVRLDNRIVMAPMTRTKSPHGVPGDDVAEYYARRARGGVGLIITEGTTIEHAAANPSPDVPAFFGAAALAGWREVVRRVHAEGGKIFPQLWHVGAARRPGTGPHTDVSGYSPSGIAKPGGKVVGHAMTERDIADVIGAYASAGANAKALGFDGLELHAAHGYLIDQFLWQGMNQRDDGYGGSPETRTRFATEIVRAVRAAVGPGFPLVLRYSQWKLQDYRAKLADTPAQLGALLERLVDAGVDVFHCSTRRYFQPEFEGSPLNLAGWTKKLTGKPTITVGSVGLDTEFVGDAGMNSGNTSDLDNLLERLAHDEFDLVAVGRALIGDADWARKVREGRQSEIHGFDRAQLDTLV
ncbi:MAG: NADH:flavin oxidoreductase/NADH oxidase [Myxococcaceae bacterium]|nr:NADH:flavin oxidoreductase/NADH oxidase [Myxococcaceae bacterium]